MNWVYLQAFSTAIIPFTEHSSSGTTHGHLQPLSEPKSALIRIKAGIPSETRVRGYRYIFKLALAFNCTL